MCSQSNTGEVGDSNTGEVGTGIGDNKTFEIGHNNTGEVDTGGYRTKSDLKPEIRARTLQIRARTFEIGYNGGPYSQTG
ncbi:hypothetical protein U1Q18_001295, partial [Sarracenia purpurea var. burkii]